MTLTAKDVAEITRLLEESSFDEMMLELDGLKLTLRRGAVPGATAAAPCGASTARPEPASAADLQQRASAAAATPTITAAAAAAAAAADEKMQEVTAPLLGTFYRAPKPGAAPFVEIGSEVEEETIIGIIEVMKLMNTVRAGTRGKVAQILAQDGALVEYGEALIRVTRAVPV